MNIGRGMAVRRDLGQLFEGQSVAGLGEVQLLERFVERRDGTAFAALVTRHGPMVLGICRRLLADPFDVEDAFQATFLVLARRAGSLRDGDRLAPWLYGVARKVATRARADLARRRAREGSGVEALAVAIKPDDPTRELGRALIEEIDRLPKPLRDPILLCCVEGLSYDEAADRLRSTAPAIRGRLARARTRLKDRLTRRGFAPTVATLGTLLSAEAASAAVPARLLTTTIQVAKAGAVPVGVEILAEGVIRTMILTKSKILAAAVVACGVAGSGVGLVAQDAPPPRPTETPAPVDRLDQVEKKLDRLLQALERKPDVRFGTATEATKLDSRFAPVEEPAELRAIDPVTRRPIGRQVPPEPAEPPAPPRPPKPPKMFDLTTNIDVEVLTKEAGEQVKQILSQMKADSGTIVLQQKDGHKLVIGPSGISVDGAPPSDARLDALEKKVNSFEGRLLKLERKLGEAPATSDLAPKKVEYKKAEYQVGAFRSLGSVQLPISLGKPDDAPPK